jgi:hypothetical protein
MRANVLKALMVVVFFGGLLGTGCKASHDRSWTRMLLGTWRHESILPSGIVVKGDTTYFEKGTWSTYGSIISAQGEVRTLLSGTWKIRDGHLHYTIESSNISELVPNGFSTENPILSVTDREFIYVNPNTGETNTALRVR